jgi:hypothetical protein
MVAYGREKCRSRYRNSRHRGVGIGASVVGDLEHMVVTFDKAGQDRASPQIDFLGSRRDLDAPGRSDLDDALALDYDHLIAREPVRLAVEQLRGVNHNYLLPQTRTCEPKGEHDESK